MSTNKAVRRLNQDISRLHKAQHREKADAAKIKKAQASEKKQLDAITTKEQGIIDQFEAAATSPLDPATQQKLLGELFDLGKQSAQVKDHASSVIAADKKDKAAAHKSAHNALETGRHHLRAAEYHLGLHATNVDRHALGLHAVKHVIRPPMNLHTVKGCAQFLLKSKNVSFWSGLSTGSDRKNLERLAKGEKAYVPATGGHVTPKLKMMEALVAMAKHGHVMINALTGGHHAPNSNHYHGTAVDLDLSTGNAAALQRIAARYGGHRNFETSHIHLDF